MPDLQLGCCRFESGPGLLRTKVYSAFHPSGVGKWVPVIAGKAKAGTAHSDCGWTCGCAGKTVKSLENTCHTWALLQWWFTTKRCYIKCMDPYLLSPSVLWHRSLDDRNGIQPAQYWVLVCWWWRFDGNFACLIALVVTTTSITLRSNKIQNRNIPILAKKAHLEENGHWNGERGSKLGSVSRRTFRDCCLGKEIGKHMLHSTVRLYYSTEILTNLN